MKTQVRRRGALVPATAVVVAFGAMPATAGASVLALATGNDGNPVAIGTGLNVRYMNQQITVAAASTDHWRFDVVGPPPAGLVSSQTPCTTGSSNDGRYVDYIGNGPYTVRITTYSDGNCTTGANTTTLQFVINASTALGPPLNAVLTRKAGSVIPNTVNVPIDLNPGALATEAWVARNVATNPDGSLAGTPTQLFPDSATGRVAVRLDRGPGNYVVVARAKGYPGAMNAQAFSPWSAPITIKTFDPFDLERFRWTDQQGPSYRLTAKIRSAAVTGRVSLAIGKGTKGKYRSLGSVKVSKDHTFSKRFRLSGTGKYRIRFKYKGNAGVAGGFEVRKFQIRRTIRFARTASAAAVVAR